MTLLLTLLRASVSSLFQYVQRTCRERKREKETDIQRWDSKSHTSCMYTYAHVFIYVYPPSSNPPSLFCHINRSLLCFTYIQRWDRKAHTSWYKNFAATDCDSSKVSGKVTHLVVQNTSSDRLRQTRIALRQMFAEIFDQMNGCTCFKVRREMRLFIYICFWFVCV